MSEEEENDDGKRFYRPNPRSRNPWTQNLHKACIKYGDDARKYGGHPPGGLKFWEQAKADDEPFARGRTPMAMLSHYKDYHECEYPDDKKPYTPMKIRENKNKEDEESEGSSEIPSSPTTKKLKRRFSLALASKSPQSQNKVPRMDAADQTKLKEKSRGLHEGETISLIDFVISSHPQIVQQWYDLQSQKPVLHCMRCHEGFLEDDDSKSCAQRHTGKILQKPVKATKKIGKDAKKSDEDPVYIYSCCGKEVIGSLFCWKEKHTADKADVNYDEWGREEKEKLANLQFRNVSYLSGLPMQTCASCRTEEPEEQPKAKKAIAKKKSRAK